MFYTIYRYIYLKTFFLSYFLSHFWYKQSKRKCIESKYKKKKVVCFFNFKKAHSTKNNKQI